MQCINRLKCKAPHLVIHLVVVLKVAELARQDMDVDVSYSLSRCRPILWPGVAGYWALEKVAHELFQRSGSVPRSPLRRQPPHTALQCKAAEGRTLWVQSLCTSYSLVPFMFQRRMSVCVERDKRTWRGRWRTYASPGSNNPSESCGWRINLYRILARYIPSGTARSSAAHHKHASGGSHCAGCVRGWHAPGWPW